MEFYTINEKYYQILARQDTRLEYLKDSGYPRPFVGEVIKKSAVSFYVPLSSPKKKHRYLQENIDFIKIKKGSLGVLNLNNMIPVPKQYQEKLVIASIQNEKYRRLLSLQKEWIESHSYVIEQKANKLYEMAKKNKLDKKLEKRCCHFQELEEIAKWQKSILYFQEEKEFYQCA